MVPRDMREPTYFILAALLDGPRHGYAIAQQAREASDGRVRLTAGTLYGALDRLREEGLVVVDREETVNGRPRRYYVLTEDGRDALVGEARAKEAAAKLVLRVAPA
jgi:DNA-binding PadR family transcriptional regulator